MNTLFTKTDLYSNFQITLKISLKNHYGRGTKGPRKLRNQGN